MSAQPGVAPEIFRYSVRDDSVARAIDALAGQRVKLTYTEHRGVPTSCFGETDYFAVGVRPADGELPIPGAPAPATPTPTPAAPPAGATPAPVPGAPPAP
jgi:hypothetical protein